MLNNDHGETLPEVTYFFFSPKSVWKIMQEEMNYNWETGSFLVLEI